ncbi:MAP7 domain-containing protein 3 isoform X6 [Ambystoma mexicanum]|uniref:MAP7 domain-containing protein 3 isoform X6 n=1 Tax=Ambystoma mexicanum TaxID=8296 RepID=UPI0037E88FCA
MLGYEVQTPKHKFNTDGERGVAAAQAIAEERRNQSGSSPVPSSGNIKTATKPVIDGSALRTDERQRLARERREEREKQYAAKESQMIEREKKAKLQYEKQMEERHRKMEGQKLKEEQRRAAVEEKRKIKTEEEKERNEAVLRRTLERSQRMEQRQKRWSWGGATPSDSDNQTATKRSTSSSNLKQSEIIISKRLSSSSATLLNSSEKTRRSQNSPLESNIISRLLAPTQASLARSKSAAALSADGKDLPESHLCPRSASAISMNNQVHTPKGPMRSRSIDRQTSAPAASVSSAEAISPESIQKPEPGKQSPSLVKKRPPSPSNVANRRRSPSPANVTKRPPSPSTLKQPQKNRPPSPVLLKQRPLSATHKQAPITRPSLTPPVINVTKKKSDVDSKPKDKSEEETTQELLSPTSEKELTIIAPKTKEDVSSKIPSGTITAEEAAKNLAEKRRIAREQRERDEKDKVQRAEEERIRKEEQDKRAAEDKVKREEELLKLEEMRQAEEEELLKKTEEQRIQKELEEQERLAELQQQREEAEAKALEEAEKQKLEREKIMQKNMQERLARKKRIEEIMKRTRKTDQGDGKNEEKSDDLEAEDIEYEEFMCSEYTNQHEHVLEDTSKTETALIFLNGDEQNCDKESNEESPSDEMQPQHSSLASKENIQNTEILQGNEDEAIDLVQNRNGKSSSWTFEEIIDLGVHSKPTKLPSDSITINNCNQDLIDADFIPTIPKLAFEQDGGVNVLTKSIDAASDV